VGAAYRGAPPCSAVGTHTDEQLLQRLRGARRTDSERSVGPASSGG
jgi:hypothetical protein